MYDVSKSDLPAKCLRSFEQKNSQSEYKLSWSKNNSDRNLAPTDNSYIADKYHSFSILNHIIINTGNQRVIILTIDLKERTGYRKQSSSQLIWRKHNK